MRSPATINWAHMLMNFRPETPPTTRSWVRRTGTSMDQFVYRNPFENADSVPSTYSAVSGSNTNAVFQSAESS